MDHSSEKKIQVKALNNSDGGAAAKLILAIQRDEFGVDITLADQPDLQDIEGFYHGSGGTFLGAFAGDELIGTIALIGIGHHSGAIRKMFVKEAFRGKVIGAAQLLLDELIRFCEKQQIRTVYLGTISRFTAAMRFYERNGFYQVDAAALPEYFPRMKLDHIFYRRDTGTVL
ncbi:MAG: GNAT family N-acetyltransferase [Mucilaginibacter polytrichastri]|nr:GNAT family N-acetyltransferase [Mucilaginibacter polytrichastri]